LGIDLDMSSTTAKKIVIVSPVFNDWEAFGQLLEQLGQLDEARAYEIHVIAVDDHSTEPYDIAALNARKGRLADVRVVRLACNLGSTRAIASGLVVASRLESLQAVVIMDADGEDRPADVGRLITTWETQPQKIVVARRSERSETPLFKCFYAIYKQIFKFLTGQHLAFGNFSIVPQPALLSLVRNPAIWNNLSGAINRSRIPYLELPISRGIRFAGRSRMSFESLVVHGFSAMSVYSDIVLVRIIIAMSFFSVAVLLGLLVTLGIKAFTNWAIPGWTSYVAASLTILLFQTLSFSTVVLFQLLNVRSLKSVVPAEDADAFILRIVSFEPDADRTRERERLATNP
jgi:polyisoprenyl-phosphate glycosyltransferase